MEGGEGAETEIRNEEGVSQFPYVSTDVLVVVCCNPFQAAV